MLVKSLQLKSGYVLREMGGEFNIFYEKDKNNGSLVCMPSINELGIFLWSRLEKGDTCEQLVEKTMVRNGMDHDEAEMDVAEFLAKLIHAEVVTYER